MKNPLDWKIFRMSPGEIAGIIVLLFGATLVGLFIAGSVLAWTLVGGHL